VNKYKPPSTDPMDVRTIDNSAVRASQVARINKIKASRDTGAVESSLKALTEAARSGKGNLLELAIVAARARATVGEISDALEVVYSRYQSLFSPFLALIPSLTHLDDTARATKAQEISGEIEHVRMDRAVTFLRKNVCRNGSVSPQTEFWWGQSFFSFLF
jgi:hypothetical protein